MPPTDREVELIETAAAVVGALILAVERVDRAAILAEVERLLNAIVKHNRSLGERSSDAPLRAAMERLQAGGREP